MRYLTGRALALVVYVAFCVAVPAQAVVTVVWGESWEGPTKSLQALVNCRYGTGKINVKTDYLGAKDGDPDPWFWLGEQLSALRVREVAGYANDSQVGWYQEKGSYPVLRNDGVDDGLLFDGLKGTGATAIVDFSKPMTRFGFYMNPNGPRDATNAPEPEKFYTNRTYNDAGPDGTGALHEPSGGDVQVLVYDISRFKGANTWLVCFEDRDSGATPGPLGMAQTDNDFDDFVFEVTAYGATPVQPLTFGALRSKYAH
jgi:hypothetical protein